MHLVTLENVHFEKYRPRLLFSMSVNRKWIIHSFIPNAVCSGFVLLSI